MKTTCNKCKYKLKCSLTPLEIYYPAISKNKLDSFWYYDSNIIASMGKYKVAVAGDITIIIPNNISLHNEEAIDWAFTNGLNDKTLGGKKFEYNNNNWFEVYDNTDGEAIDGDYNSAMSALIDINLTGW